MMKGFSGTTEAFFIGVLASFVLFFQFGLFGGCSPDPSPRDGANEDCEEAWVVQNDGDDDTENETAILEQPWCINHLATEEAEVQQEQIEAVAP